MTELDWNTLLSDKRLIRDGSGNLTLYNRPETPPRTPAEADVQRIIFSTPFRRLAGKTQVHPFARVDYVHNRLTHSLEVAETGTALTQQVMRNLNLPEDLQQAAAYHVRAASLGHDIGNPPYGHVGEAIIRDWGRERREDLFAFLTRRDHSAREAEAVCRDILHFDGNAQTFRLLSHPMPREGAHFRLTCGTLGTLIKYPHTSSALSESKYSCFFSAREEFAAVQQELGLQPGVRHPLSYILEIADDICYCVTDCEDALLMEILDAETVRGWFLRLFADRQEAAGCKSLPIAHLRAKVIHHLLSAFAAELVTCFREPAALAAIETHSAAWARLKALKRDYSVVFSDTKKLEKERRIREDLLRTLDLFFEALLASEHAPQQEATRRAIAATFGEGAQEKLPSLSPVEKLHMLLDAVTGMSDASLHHFIHGR